MFATLLQIHFIFLSLLSLLGYTFATALSLICLPFLFFKLVKENRNIYSFILLSILFLVVFDNDELNFTELKIRPWYFFIFFTFIASWFKFTKNFNKFYINKSDILSLIFFSYFFIMSVLFFLIEDSASRLYNFKYWFFGIGLIFVLFYNFKYSNFKITEALEIWYFTLLFATSWGLIQFSGNILGFAGDKLQHDWFNVSPSAFFSERTWYGQYSSICLILSLFYYYHRRNFYYLLLSFISICCAALSFSRSAIIPIFCSFFVLFFFNIFKNISIKNFFLSFVIICVTSAVIFFALSFMPDNEYLLSYFDKFRTDDVNVQGRFEALELFFYNFYNDPYSYILGNGFKWDESQVSSIGTAVGAKSSNLFLMIFYIFGITGLLLSVYIFSKCLLSYIKLVIINNCSIALLGLSLYISFFALTLFVPAHQFPSSLTILFFSLLIYRHYKSVGIH